MFVPIIIGIGFFYCGIILNSDILTFRISTQRAPLEIFYFGFNNSAIGIKI
jgi:hypothetical protein